MEKVSVIIPVYNTEFFLEKSFDSILKQTYTNIELIVINDGSNEETTIKLREYAKIDNRINLYELSERKGVGHARNIGLTKATGKYIYYFDSDDYLANNTIDLLVTYIKDDPMISGGVRTTHFLNSYAVVFDGLFKASKMTGNRFNLITRNASVNFLFRKDYLIENNYLFSENVEVFSDLTFIVPALGNLQVISHVREALYFRRRRNDPIKNPSLQQSDALDKAKDFIKVYLELKKINLNEETTEFINHQLMNYYRKDIVKLFKKEENIDELFEDLTQAFKKVEDEQLKNYDRILKREITPILKENKGFYKRRNARYQFLREVKNIALAKNKKVSFARFIYRNVFLRLPVKQGLVYFESFGGKSYSDSPKYIYEYLIENKDQYKYVWHLNSDDNLPGNAKIAKTGSIRYYYTLAVAEYIVTNARLPLFFEKREGVNYLQTWHGTPLKRLGGDMEEVHMPGTNTEMYKINFYNESQKWDYLIAPNSYSSEILSRAFWFDKTLLEVGYPRNDLLYTKNNAQDIADLKMKLNVPKDKKVVLYAPTWRDDEYYSKGNYTFELKLNLDRMQKELGNEYVIILRMHYLIASEMDISSYEGFVYDFSLYNDIGELYLISDLLITDYSSVFFDYANLKRPILFYTYDIDKYRDQLRGFYLDMNTELPGPLLKTTEEVIHKIKNINELNNDYASQYKEFYNRFCEWDDGKASEKTVKTVFNK